MCPSKRFNVNESEEKTEEEADETEETIETGGATFPHGRKITERHGPVEIKLGRKCGRRSEKNPHPTLRTKKKPETPKNRRTVIRNTRGDIRNVGRCN